MIETDIPPIEKIRVLEKIIDDKNEELELLEAAFELSEVGFTISNADGVVIKINPSQIRITGHHPEMTLGRSMALIESENNNKSATMHIVKTQTPITMEQILPTGKSYLVYGQPYFKDDKLKYIICNLVDSTQHNLVRQELEKANDNNIQLEKRIHHLQGLMKMQKNLVYTSGKMQKVIDVCDKIAPFDSTVLISGESGVGKEIIVDYIYNKSNRAQKTFTKINCAAIPENLLESELFGYETGAFTSARSGGKEGIFEIADGGTVLLDEVGELPLHLQSKLLRVLQEGEFFRIGGTKPIRTDLRIIASTNRDLEEMVEAGSFRKDLYFRISVIKITVPPLSERKEDIPMLIRHFMTIFNEKHQLNKELSFAAMEYLVNLPYEGNVRDLQNTIERVLLLSHDDTIDLKETIVAASSNFDIIKGDKANSDDIFTNPSLKELVSQYERELLRKYWVEYGSASVIAKILKTSQPTVSRKLKLYDII